MSLNFFNITKSSKFQQFLMFFAIIYIASILLIQYKQSYFAEENVKLAKISIQEERLTSLVETGLHINNFTEFSFYKNSFVMDCIVWFKFPVGSESIQTIKKFGFKNGKILSKSSPVVQLHNNKAIISYQVLAKFSTPLNYKYFPAGDHKLTIILQNKSVSPTEMYFLSNNYGLELSDNISSGSWAPSKHYVETGYIQTKFKQEKGAVQTDFPCVAYTIDFKNHDLRHFIILYLPLLLIFLLIFTSLLTKIDELGLRFPIVAGVIPILALHSLVIESISPPSGNMTKIDKVYFTLVGLAMVILVFQSFVVSSIKTYREKKPEELEKKKEKLRTINAIIILFVITALTSAITYFTLS